MLLGAATICPLGATQQQAAGSNRTAERVLAARAAHLLGAWRSWPTAARRRGSQPTAWEEQLWPGGKSRQRQEGSEASGGDCNTVVVMQCKRFFTEQHAQ